MRTLLLEDDPAVACFVEAYLEDEGFQVTVTSTPDSALAAASTAEAFDLLVTDFNRAAQADGADVARALKERQPTLAVVMISGRPFDAHKRMAGLGSSIVLPKPFTGADLLDAIDQAIKRGA